MAKSTKSTELITGSTKEPQLTPEQKTEIHQQKIRDNRNKRKASDISQIKDLITDFTASDKDREWRCMTRHIHSHAELAQIMIAEQLSPIEVRTAHRVIKHSTDYTISTLMFSIGYEARMMSRSIELHIQRIGSKVQAELIQEKSGILVSEFKATDMPAPHELTEAFEIHLIEWIRKTIQDDTRD